MSSPCVCRLCPRLAGFRDELQIRFPDYHNLPVDAFGPTGARLLVIGLAPGLHGANRTGRPFTGDASGDLLFKTLYRFGFAMRDVSRSPNDDMRLNGCRITNAVKCVPPQNRPEPAEVNNCNAFLAAEIGSAEVLLVLGLEALKAVSLALGLGKSAFTFVHGAESATPGGQFIVVSYDLRRRNTNTGKLTPEMFERLFTRVQELLQ